MGVVAMSDQKWQRYALIGGPVFVVLAILSTLLAGSPPAPDASTAKVNSFFADHHGAIKAGAWIGVLSTIFVVWWFATLWRYMSDSEGGRPRLAIISLGGLVLAGALNGVGIAILSGMAMRYQDLGDNAGLLWAINSALAPAAAIGLALHIGAVAVLGVRTNFLPLWVSGFGALAALANVVATLGVLSDSSGAFAFLFIGFFAWALWIIVVSVVLWQRPTLVTDVESITVVAVSA
jgi:hypothetical protein